MVYKLSEQKAREVVARIREKIQAYFSSHNLTYAVFGKSEGLDSSVIAGLLSNLEGVRPLGVVIPIETEARVLAIARDVLAHFEIPRVEVDLTEDYLRLKSSFVGEDSVLGQIRAIGDTFADENLIERIEDQQVEKLALGNIKVRLRMITLYHIAQLVGGLVVSTDNFSEYWMGFWTLCGDVGDICPIQPIFKGTELYTIGKVLGIPEASLNAPPSDGLGITEANTDEAQLGLPYDQLDRVILRLVRERFLELTAEERQRLLADVSAELEIPPANIDSVSQRMQTTEFKRRWPVMFTRAELGLPSLDQIYD